MPEIQGTITHAAPRTIERRDGSGSFPLYEVWIDGQGPFVARKDVFGIAQQLMGARVVAITRDEMKNGFQNHYLDFVALVQGQPADQTAAQAVQAAQAAQQPPAQQTVPVTQTAPQTPVQTAEQVLSQPSPEEERKNLSIHRQTAAKVAAVLSPGNEIDFWQNVTALVRFFQTGVKPMAGYTQPDLRSGHEAYRPFADNTADPGADPTKPPPDDNSVPF